MISYANVIIFYNNAVIFCVGGVWEPNDIAAYESSVGSELTSLYSGPSELYKIDIYGP